MVHRPPPPPSRPRWVTHVRDAVTFAGGVALAFHEAVVAAAPRWELLALAAALVGIAPAAITNRGFQQDPAPPEGDDPPAAPTGRRRAP